MRLVIDLQGAQGEHRKRGIGRYSISLAKAMASNRHDHDVFVVLNGSFPDSVEEIRAELREVVSSEKILTWSAPEPADFIRANRRQRRVAELLREHAIASVSPDFVLLTSVFEGLSDNAVTSVSELSSGIPTAAVLYDLIPLINEKTYLGNSVVKRWYESKLTHVRRADLLLTISNSTRREAIEYLGIEDHGVVNISSAVEDRFVQAVVSESDRRSLEIKYGIGRPFVMYTGGIDPRKNIEGLIKAYAGMPTTVRDAHQLVIVCAITEADRVRLQGLARDSGLGEGDLVLTGYVSEKDLLVCYRSCELFVFPSWHEGFGLPALEAMKCGRAVLVSDIPSLAEVVALPDSLFDPFDLQDLSGKIAAVLQNAPLRRKLERHGLKRASQFSWERTSRQAWSAIEKFCNTVGRDHRPSDARSSPLPRLAYFSPLPPQASGISDYSAELLPELARHYRIDVITTPDIIDDVSVCADLPLRDIAWFRRNAHEFDRILYHFGNSEFHSHLFDLLRDYPGVVVLHDFYLSGIVAHRELTGEEPSGWTRALLEAHGWAAVVEKFTTSDLNGLTWVYPCSQQVMQEALGVIVHSEHSRKLAVEWYGPPSGGDLAYIPLLRQPLLLPDRCQARRVLGLAEDDFVVCSFGMLGPTKSNDRLLSAWLSSSLSKQSNCRLVFVGRNVGGDYGDDIDQQVQMHFPEGQVQITGRVDLATFRTWLAAADVGVQLRTLSRGETSAAVLDCMNAGLPTIVNAHGSMAELPSDTVWKIDDRFSDNDLARALVNLWQDPEKRREISSRAKSYIKQHHQPRACALGYAKAIESYYAKASIREPSLQSSLVEVGVPDKEERIALARCISRNSRPSLRKKRLLVDISELVHHDARSGIQRVVRSILVNWLKSPPIGWIVEPVYAEFNKPGYRFARRFTSGFLGIWDGWAIDEPVETFPGDVFVGLDLQSGIVPQQVPVLKEWQRRGVFIQFVVYDLLPTTLPQHFVPGARVMHHRWIEAIAKFDGAICISRAVADELYDWLQHYGPERNAPLELDWFHLGGDTEGSQPTRGLPENAERILSLLRENPSFLMVGTLEPRKGHRQALLAFESIWQSGLSANLVIVGKLGWMMDDFVAELANHDRFGTNLFWLEGISDEFLDEVYKASSCLVAASEGEGFGLPLIEAGRHGLPVIARDIPVFREVGGDDVAYFADTNDASAVAKAVKKFLKDGSAAKKVTTREWQTWAESAQCLLDRVLGSRQSYRSWEHDGALRLQGNDFRMQTEVGVCEGNAMLSTGNRGFLLFGPGQPWKSGRYRLKARGTACLLVGTEHLEVVSEKGSVCHLSVPLQAQAGCWFIDETVSIESDLADIEIRAFVDHGSKIALEFIELLPLADAARRQRKTRRQKVKPDVS